MVDFEKSIVAELPSELEAIISMFVKDHDAPHTLRKVAHVSGMSLATLNRKFQHFYGMTPMRWLWEFRTFLAAELITMAPHLTLATVADKCGFATLAHFSRRFHGTFKQPPKNFRANQAALKETKLIPTSLLEPDTSELKDQALRALHNRLQSMLPPSK
jgi:transcriptional regulator GlxA family with amidase domain